MDIFISDVVLSVGKENRSLFQIPGLKISSGEKVLIQAPSGVGKSSFLHLLAGMVVPQQGSVTIGEVQISSLSEDQRARFRREDIGFIFQKLNLIDHLTGLENVELGAAPEQFFERAVGALKAVGLSGREHDAVSNLSLGEQQRVAVARVLASDCRMVFADEPTSSLDRGNSQTVMQLLTETTKNKTLIVVSHDERIAGYFDQIIDFLEWVR